MKSCESLWRCMRRGWTALLLPPMMFVLAACQSIPATRTDETEKTIAADVCRAWQVTPYSSRDTPETQLGNRANNAARAAYCRGK